MSSYPHRYRFVMHRNDLVWKIITEDKIVCPKIESRKKNPTGGFIIIIYIYIFSSELSGCCFFHWGSLLFGLVRSTRNVRTKMFNWMDLNSNRETIKFWGSKQRIKRYILKWHPWRSHHIEVWDFVNRTFWHFN